MEDMTDEQYLDLLYNQYADHAWISVEQRKATEEFISNALEAAIAEGICSPEDYETTLELIREDASPSRKFRGSMVEELRGWALEFAEDYRHQLEAIPVALLPSRLLNAFAVRTPRGGSVIVLDSGSLFQVGVLVFTYFAFCTWYSDKPYCRDHSQYEFGRTISRLADYSVTGDPLSVREMTTLKCPSLPFYERRVANFCSLIESFILVHEYGHVVLGHLNPESTKSISLSPEFRFTAYTKSQAQEFEADEFAFSQMVATGNRGRTAGKETLAAIDLAFPVGLLFKFFSLRDAIHPPMEPDAGPTHPPAHERWNRIKKFASVTQDPNSFAFQLDPAFDAIFRSAGLPPPREAT